MSQKQKVFAGAIVVVIAIGFGFVYRQFSNKVSTQTAKDAASTMVAAPVQSEQQLQDAVVPSTPDAAVDAIIDDAALDDKAMENEASGEKDAITSSGEEINTLGQTYDENQL